MASNKPNPEWWTKVPKDLELHDKIWFNTIRVLISVNSRSSSWVADVALDQLIRQGLIDWEEKEVSLAMQQWLCYLAILANCLANSQGILAKEVFVFIWFVWILINQGIVFLF